MGSANFSAQVGSAEAAEPRLGLAVSRRVSKRAVRRNRIKRIARDSFRRHRTDLPPCDVLVIARASADAQDNASLHAELATLWRRIAALNAAGGTGTMRG